MTAAEAIEHLARSIRREARKLAPLNVHDREDIEQEMNLAILEAGSSGVWPIEYYKKAAHNAAVKYLDRQILHDKKDDGTGRPRQISLDQAIKDGAEL